MMSAGFRSKLRGGKVSKKWLQSFLNIFKQSRCKTYLNSPQKYVRCFKYGVRMKNQIKTFEFLKPCPPVLRPCTKSLHTDISCPFKAFLMHDGVLMGSEHHVTFHIISAYFFLPAHLFGYHVLGHHKYGGGRRNTLTIGLTSFWNA